MSNHAKNAIFVDGASVAKEHQPGKSFSVVGLLRCAVYFRQREFQTKIILHRNYRALASGGRLEDGDQLLKLEGSGLIVFSPIGEDEKEFLIQLGLDHGGVIVSNETFEREKGLRNEWAHFVNRRRLPFRFINHEFAPMPPTVDGHVMEIEEFLRSSYDMGGDFSSAAALASFLLTTNVDDGDHSRTSSTRSGDQRLRSHTPAVHQRERDRNRYPTIQQRRYTVGQVIEVFVEHATVEFQIKKDGHTALTTFARDAYHPNGRLVWDLCREFRVGDWIGFISVKMSDGRWMVKEVRKKGEMKRGYGRFRALANNSASGLIEARYKFEAGGGDVFFPGAAFRDENTLLSNLNRGHWLYYYAFDQKPSAGCTAVAIEVFSATAAGVIVQKNERHVYVWSVKIGLGRGVEVDFEEGTWVKFRFQQRRENNETIWVVSDLETLSIPVGVNIEIDHLDESVVHIRCPAIAGVVDENHGSIWTETFGRMSLSNTCLKQIRAAEPDGLKPYQPVRIWAVYDGDKGISESLDEGSDKECAAAASKASKRGEAWRVLTILATSGAAASGADPPYPPPSVIFGVDATLMDVEDDTNSARGQHWIFSSEKHGKIFATPFDLVGGQKHLQVGDRVKATIVPQALGFGDEYRALVVEKVRGPVLP